MSENAEKGQHSGAEAPIKLRVITHEKVVFERDVDAVYSQGVNGRFGVLKDHIPFVTALDVGVTKVLNGNEPTYITTMGGIFQFKDNEATILTDTAELGDDIDLVRAQEAKERAEERLRSKAEEMQIVRAQIALSKAMARISAAEKKY